MAQSTEEIRQRVVRINSRLQYVANALRCTPNSPVESKGDPGSPDIAATLTQIHCQLNRSVDLMADIEREILGAPADVHP